MKTGKTLLSIGAIVVAVLSASLLLQDCSSRNTLSGAAKENRDAIITDLSTLAADAYQYKIRPESMGGGKGSYYGYFIAMDSPWGPKNPNAIFTLTTQTATQMIMTATSKNIPGATVVLTIDSMGRFVADPVSSGFDQPPSK